MGEMVVEHGQIVYEVAAHGWFVERVETSKALAEDGISCDCGHFYAFRVNCFMISP